MRLTCPTCGAEYEIADAMVPASGRHVQCTACHTRWFVRGEAPQPESEDDIMQRLEARSHLRAVPSRPRPVEPEPTTPTPAAIQPKPEPAGPLAQRPEPVPAAPAPQPEPPARPVPNRPVAGESSPVPRPATAPRAVPAKPATQPMVSGDRLGLRPAPRLDLGAEPRPPAPREAPPPSRFGRGLALALVLFGVALGAYLWRADIAARVPAAAPALDAYGETVDDLRLELAQRIDDLRG